MCGIAGLIAPDSHDLIARMSSALAHRGPDGAGEVAIRSRGEILGWLAHRRLAIIDLSDAGRQPMSCADGRLWITYNGEVYNFRDVRAKLERAGARFRSQSDTEVVVKAYEHWGEACLGELRGMFAFAIWDADRRRLFIARDRLGIKPLYYYCDEGKLLFASEVRTLLASGQVPRTLSAAGLLNYLTFGSVYDPITLIEGVYSLQPGHYLVWENGYVKEMEYWDIEPVAVGVCEEQRAYDSLALSQNEERVVEELRGILEESVRLHLVSDVPVGVFLSGGIDSSAIVAMLSRGARLNVKTFSIVFKEMDYSETRFSQAIARLFETDHHEMLLSQQDAIEAIPAALRAMDQPTMDGVNTYLVAREASREGLKVALSGLGGDEAFGGYNSFETVPKMERFAARWSKVPAGIRKPVGAIFTALLPGNDRNAKLTALIQGNGESSNPYLLSRMLFTSSQQSMLVITPDAASSQSASRCVQERLARAGRFDPVNRVSYLEMRNYMANTLLRDADSMSMAHGLEVRVPLIDHKLIEYLFALPGSSKIDKDTPKHLLVKAGARLLPDEIVHRTKRGFTLPFEHWLKDEMRDEVEKTLLGSDDNPLGDHLSREGVRSVWEAFLDGRTSWTRPWALYALSRWCELNL